MIVLVCADTGETLAEVPTAPAVMNAARRLVGGLAAPYNVVGTPNLGRAIFRAGSIAVPPNRSYVKLLVQHDDNQAVGYMTDVDELPAGLIAAYRVAPGAAGDAALEGVANQTRDGLSVRVEVDKWNRLADGTIEVIASRLRETSLVSIPAYDDARVRLEASNPNQERAAVMARLTEMLDLKASAPAPDPTTPPAPAPAPDPAAPPAPAPAPDPAAPPTAPTLLRAASAPAIDATQLAAYLAPLFAGAPPVAGSPASLPLQAPRPHVAPAAGPATLQAAGQVVADWARRDGQNVNTLFAALSDVVPSDDAGEGFLRPAWINELWTASVADRPFIDALGTPKPLTAMTVKGWKWVTKPTVATYAGDKAAIPSNAVETAPAEASALRLAGGWDIDRIYLDLGDPSFITALFEAATEDYRRKTNAAVGTALMAAATASTPADVTALSFSAALVGMAAQAAAVGASMNWIAVASDVYAELASLSSDDLPWWMSGGSLAVGDRTGVAPGFKFWADASLATGRILAGDTRAATFYEVSNPIRVQAVNIPNGGIDLGVFGYHALIVNDARALFTATVDSTP